MRPDTSVFLLAATTLLLLLQTTVGEDGPTNAPTTLATPTTPTTFNQPPTNPTTSSTVTPQTQGRRPSIWSRTIHHQRQGHGPHRRPYLRRSTEMRPVPQAAAPPLAAAVADEETQFLQSSAILSLKDFANQFVNETAALFKSAPRARSVYCY